MCTVATVETKWCERDFTVEQREHRPPPNLAKVIGCREFTNVRDSTYVFTTAALWLGALQPSQRAWDWEVTMYLERFWLGISTNLYSGLRWMSSQNQMYPTQWTDKAILPNQMFFFCVNSDQALCLIVCIKESGVEVRLSAFDEASLIFR